MKTNYVLATVCIAIILTSTVFVTKSIEAITVMPTTEVDTIELNVASKPAEEYYEMFKCLCCGKSIDAECCGMAKQLKDYVDGLISKGLSEQEILLSVVKNHGFDVLMDESMADEIRQYIKETAPADPPVISLDNTVYDFGTISQSDGVITTTFIISNTGLNDLVIENLDTSCMCTEASLVYNGVESPRFGMSMHGDNPKDFKLTIPSGQSAELKVFYDPNAHGEQTQPQVSIVRVVTIVSNDPYDFQKEVRIELVQVP